MFYFFGHGLKLLSVQLIIYKNKFYSNFCHPAPDEEQMIQEGRRNLLQSKAYKFKIAVNIFFVKLIAIYFHRPFLLSFPIFFHLEKIICDVKDQDNLCISTKCPIITFIRKNWKQLQYIFWLKSHNILVILQYVCYQCMFISLSKFNMHFSLWVWDT